MPSSRHHTLRRLSTNWNKFRVGQQKLETKSYEDSVKELLCMFSLEKRRLVCDMTAVFMNLTEHA